jgi:hypothetical protein
VKVLLISANTEQFNMPVMPLGLACVSAAVAKADHDVILMDLMFEKNANGILKKAITEFYPECIGISVRNIDDQNFETPVFLLDKVKEVVSVCRELTDAPIVLGGAGYSIFPESTLTYINADLGTACEGEIAFPAILSRLENSHDLSGVPGLFIRTRGLQSAIKFVERLDELTLPDPGILSVSMAKNKQLWIPVQTRDKGALSNAVIVPLRLLKAPSSESVHPTSLQTGLKNGSKQDVDCLYRYHLPKTTRMIW